MQTSLEIADIFGFLFGLSFVLKKNNGDTYGFLTGGNSRSPGDIWQCLKAFFGCPNQEEGGATGI